MRHDGGVPPALPTLDDLIERLYVVSLPMRVRFRGIDGGTAFNAARVAMMMVGKVVSVRTRPPTRLAERGRWAKLMKTARPRRP